MSSLRELQHVFADALFADDRAVPAQVRSGRFDPARHFSVYRNNVHTVLAGALGDIHPVVRRLVGDGFFRYAAAHYMRAHPPTSGNVLDFGAHFADFLGVFESARTLPYLPDVARLEWAWHESFHAAEGPRLSLEALARVAPNDYARIRFRLHPSARLGASPYPVLRIWEVNQPDYRGEDTVDLNEGGQQVLVIRRNLSVEIESLSAADFTLLSSCRDGLNVEAAAETVLAEHADFDFPGALRRHVSAATIVAFSLE